MLLDRGVAERVEEEETEGKAINKILIGLLEYKELCLKIITEHEAPYQYLQRHI